MPSPKSENARNEHESDVRKFYLSKIDFDATMLFQNDRV